MKHKALVLMTACFWFVMNGAGYLCPISKVASAGTLPPSEAGDIGGLELPAKPTLVVQLGFVGGVKSVVLSYDGQIALTGSYESGKPLTRMWDAREGKELRRFEGRAIGLSRDKTLILTTEGVWDAATGVRRWKGVARPEHDRNYPFYSARWQALVGRPEGFSPDDRYVALIQNEAVLLYEATTGKEIRRFPHPCPVGMLKFSPDSRLLLIASRQPEPSRLRSSRYQIDRNESPAPTISDSQVQSISQLWDIESGKMVQRFEGQEPVSFSNDGSFVLTGSRVIRRANSEYDSDHTMRLWSIATGKVVHRLRHAAEVTMADLSPDGRFAATRSEAQSPNEARTHLWDLGLEKELWQTPPHKSWGPRNELQLLSFLPDRQLLATKSEKGGISLLDVRTGNPVLRLPRKVVTGCAAYSGDGRYLLIGESDDASGDFDPSSGLGAYLYDVDQKAEVQSLNGNTAWVGDAKFAPDSKSLLVGGGDGQACLWNLSAGKEVLRIDTNYTESGVQPKTVLTRSTSESNMPTGHPGSPPNTVTAVAFSPNSRFFLTGGDGALVRLTDATTGEAMWQTDVGRSVGTVGFSASGREVLADDSWANHIYLLNAKNGIPLQEEIPGRMPRFSPDGRFILTNAGNVLLWDKVRGEKWWEHPVKELKDLAFSPDNQYLALADGQTVILLRLSDSRELRKFTPGNVKISKIVFSGQSDYLFLCSENRMAAAIRLKDGAIAGKTWAKNEEILKQLDALKSAPLALQGRFIPKPLGGTTQIWDMATQREVCRLISFRDGTWAVVAPDGRFDTNNLEEIKGLHWIAPDEPFRALLLEIFQRDYYEPRLLPRLLNGEPFKPIRRLSELNRVQPQVKIASVERQKDKPDRVTVTVNVAKARSERQRDQQGNLLETGVYDLRLFRNGQIVGRYSDGIPQALPQSVGNAEKLLAWRNEAQVKLDANGKRIIKFANIKLPRKTDIRQVELSAYAFNEDRVKSQTDRKTFDIPADLAPRKGRAYLITIGVNAYENPAFDLKYSVNDAKLIQSTITDKLQNSGEYEEVVTVPLISDYKKEGQQRKVSEATATKKNVKAVLDLLAGRQVEASLKKQIPNADKLQPAKPEDLVLISFSSHGYADANGNFYFVLYDSGLSTREKITETLLQKLSANFLSSEELSLWLRDVDAGEMLMIVDACHSAASVQSGEFKPGPMGSRGLGQLAYDKGMRILTATQAADVAYGIGALRQGLLTYVLVKEGIEAGKADFKPKDRTITIAEWLQYGEGGVPKLLDDAGNKAKEKDSPAEIRDLVQKTLSDVKTQRPSLFDFSRKRAEVVLVKP